MHDIPGTSKAEACRDVDDELLFNPPRLFTALSGAYGCFLAVNSLHGRIVEAEVIDQTLRHSISPVLVSRSQRADQSPVATQ